MKSAILMVVAMVWLVHDSSSLSTESCVNLIGAVQGKLPQCPDPSRSAQRLTVYSAGNMALIDDAQFRIGRSPGGFERMSRAGLNTLRMLYEECLKATDGIRFKRGPNHQLKASELKSPSTYPLEELLRQAVAVREFWTHSHVLLDSQVQIGRLQRFGSPLWIQVSHQLIRRPSINNDV